MSDYLMLGMAATLLLASVLSFRSYLREKRVKTDAFRRRG